MGSYSHAPRLFVTLNLVFFETPVLKTVVKKTPPVQFHVEQVEMILGFFKQPFSLLGLRAVSYCILDPVSDFLPVERLLLVSERVHSRKLVEAALNGVV